MKSFLTARHGLWNLWSVCRSECRSNYLNILRTALLNHRLACLLKWTCGGHQGTCLWQIYSLGESLPQFVSFCSILLPYKNKAIRRALLFSLCFSWVASGHTCFSKVKSKLAGPEAAPFGRKQTRCRFLPDQLVYNVKNTKSCFDRTHGLSKCNIFAALFPKCKQAILLSVVL